MDVALLTVGDELLSGVTVNTNSTWLCGSLVERGARVRRIVVVPDQIEAIANELIRLRDQCDRVIVTGGVGPTHDDVTMEAVAAALGRSMVEHPDAREWLLENGGYSASELVEGTADLPAGATALNNPVGVAPGAYVDGVYVLPGVPEEMKAMFETIADDFSGTVLHRNEVTVDEPESALLGRFAEIRDQFNVRVGSYPGEHVVVRITGEDAREVSAATDWLVANAATVSTQKEDDPESSEDEAKREDDSGSETSI